MVNFIRWLAIFSAIFHVAQQFNGFMVDTMNCTNSVSFCQNPVCTLTSDPNSPQVYTISVGCTLLKPVSQLLVQLRTSLKKGKLYVKTPFDVQLNLCQLGGNANMLKLVPNMENQMKSLLHPCPYQDTFMIDGLVMDAGNTLILLKNSAIRQDIIFTSGKNQPLITVFLYLRTGI